MCALEAAFGHFAFPPLFEIYIPIQSFLLFFPLLPLRLAPLVSVHVSFILELVYLRIRSSCLGFVVFVNAVLHPFGASPVYT